MRVLFAGTPDVAIPSLRALLSSSHDVVAVLTRPPAPVGRKRIVTASPVQEEAEKHGIPVLCENPNADVVLEVLRTVDCVAVVAYGQRIRQPALSEPRWGWINLHFSLLPQWRGAAPVQHALMAGDETTGISVFQIEEGLDTGPIFNTQEFSIGSQDTAGELLDALAYEGASLLVETLDQIEAGTAEAKPQQGTPSLAPSLRTPDAQIDWFQPAKQVKNHIRGLTPVPGAWTMDEQRKRFKIGPVEPVDASPLSPGQVLATPNEVMVGTGSGPVRLTQLAPPGKPWMEARAWGRGLQGAQIRFIGKSND